MEKLDEGWSRPFLTMLITFSIRGEKKRQVALFGLLGALYFTIESEGEMFVVH